MRRLILLFSLLLLTQSTYAQSSLPVITPENMDEARLLGLAQGRLMGFSAAGLMTYDEQLHSVNIWTLPDAQLTSTEIQSDRCALLSPQGSYLGTRANGIFLWDITSGWQDSRQLEAPDFAYRDYCTNDFSHDETMYIVCEGQTLYVWDTRSGELRFTFDFVAYLGQSCRVDVSPDGRWIVAPDLNTIYIIDAHSGEVVHRIEETDVTSSDLTLLKVAFRLDGRVFAAAGFGSEVKLFDVETGAQTAVIDMGASATPIIFSQDGRWLLMSAFNTVQIWDVSSEPFPVVLANVDYRLVDDSFMTADGAFLTILSGTGINRALRVWNIAASDPNPRFVVPISDDNTIIFLRYMTAFNASGDIMAAAYQTLQLYAPNEDSEVIVPYNYLPSIDNVIKFSHDGRLLAVQHGDHVLIFGVPTSEHPVWSVSANIFSSGINLRASPDRSSEVIGVASGEVRIVGRNGDFVYLPDLDGWVLGTPDYIDMGDYTLDGLPVIASTP